MTEVIRVDPQRPDPAGVARAAHCLREGGLVAFPTETVYGLGADALNRDAVNRIFVAKNRPVTDPLIVHVISVADVAPLVARVPDSVSVLAARFWPGPLTLVLPRSAAVPDEVTAGLDSVAIRVPSHPVARALIAAARVPVAAPSANLFSRPSPTRAAHVLEDLDGRIDLILDGGPTSVGVESTVLDLTGVVPTVLRPGAVTLEDLRTVLPDVRVQEGLASPASAPQASPGLLAKHYSPRTPMTLYEGPTPEVLRRLGADARAEVAAGRTVGIMAADEDALGDTFSIPRVIRLGSEHSLGTVAARLYAALRELDAAGVDVILARAFAATDGLGLAIQDRMRRAAGRIVRC